MPKTTNNLTKMEKALVTETFRGRVREMPSMEELLS